ncbi:MAG: hypothetical protein FJX35_04045 [Alphaproteobacteria bacterium]|nr:hypothetical protein [Alphaproteobacteria bacterium]
MSSELIDVVKILLVAGLGAVGWWVRGLARKIDDLAADLHAHKLNVAQHYASWSGLKELMREMEGRVVGHIKKLEDMLNRVIEIKPRGEHD